MKGHKFFVTGVLVLFLFVALPVHAATMNILGSVDTILATVPSGWGNIAVGTPLTGSIAYDETLVGWNTGCQFDIHIENLDFFYYQDQNYPATGPTALTTVVGGDVEGLRFHVTDYSGDPNLNFQTNVDMVFGSPTYGQTVFTITNGGTPIVKGTLDFVLVPVPSAILLLGSGLVALVGLRKRTRKVQ